MGLTRELNRALDPLHSSDIDVDAVRTMMETIETRKKAALAFIERQPTRAITRRQRLVFSRNIGFDGSIEEWERGRKHEARNDHVDEDGRYLRPSNGRFTFTVLIFGLYSRALCGLLILVKVSQDILNGQNSRLFSMMTRVG